MLSEGLVIKYTPRRIGEESCFPVGPKSSCATTFYVAEPINSEHNKWLETESIRVNNVAVLSKLPGNKKPYEQNGLLT